MEKNHIPSRGGGIYHSHKTGFALLLLGLFIGMANAADWANTNYTTSVPCTVVNPASASASGWGICYVNTSDSTAFNTIHCANPQIYDDTNTTLLQYATASNSSVFCGNATNPLAYYVNGTWASGSTRIWIYRGNTNTPRQDTPSMLAGTYAGVTISSHFMMESNASLADETGRNTLTLNSSFYTASCPLKITPLGFGVEFAKGASSACQYSKGNPVGQSIGAGPTTAIVRYYVSQQRATGADSLFLYGTTALTSQSLSIMAFVGINSIPNATADVWGETPKSVATPVIQNVTLTAGYTYNGGTAIKVFQNQTISNRTFSGALNLGTRMMWVGGAPHSNMWYLQNTTITEILLLNGTLSEQDILFASGQSSSMGSIADGPVGPLNCSVLNLTGTTYTMVSDLHINGSDCFTVTAANVTLECDGYAITGNSSFAKYGVTTSATGTTVRNCNIFGFNSAIRFVSGADGGAVHNTIGNNSAGSGPALSLISSNNLINNTVMIGALGTGDGLRLTVSSNNVIANSSFCSSADGTGFSGIALSIGSNNNLFYNNTICGGQFALWIYPSSSNNTFYWNNFSGNGLYINDTNGSNFYNLSEGNIYANVISGSVNISGANNSIGFPSLQIGTTGANYPYNATNSLGKFVCASSGCGDFAPLTNQLPIPSFSAPAVGSQGYLNLTFTLDHMVGSPKNCTVTLNGAIFNMTQLNATRCQYTSSNAVANYTFSGQVCTTGDNCVSTGNFTAKTFNYSVSVGFANPESDIAPDNITLVVSPQNYVGNTSAVLQYNNTNSSGIPYGTSSYYAIVNPPVLSNASTSVSFTWFLTFLNATPIFTAAHTNSTQVVAFNLTNCNVTNGTQVLFFSFYDQAAPTVPVASTMDATFTLSAAGGSFQRNFSYNFSTPIQNISLCLNLATGNYLVSSTQQFRAAGHQDMYHYLLNQSLAVPTVLNVSLYNLNTTGSILTQYLVYQGSNLPVVNAYVQIQRYYPSTNQLLTVAMAKTDSNGVAETYAIPNDVLFRYVVSKDYQVIYTSDIALLPCDPGATFCTTQILVDQGFVSEYTGFIGNSLVGCSVSADNTSVSCTSNNPSGTGTELRLRVYLIETYSNTLVCDNVLSSGAGTVACTGLNASRSHAYIGTSTVGSIMTIGSGYIGIRAKGTFNQTYGAIAAMMLIFAMFGLGMLAGFPGALVMAMLGVVLSALIGFVDLPAAAVLALVDLGLIIAWVLRGRG